MEVGPVIPYPPVMDAFVTAAEAGLSPDLLDRVERGEEVVITRDGRAVARLSKGSGHDVAAGLAAVEKLSRLRDEIAARGGEPFTIDEILSFRDGGRRY